MHFLKGNCKCDSMLTECTNISNRGRDERKKETKMSCQLYSKYIPFVYFMDVFAVVRDHSTY